MGIRPITNIKQNPSQLIFFLGFLAIGSALYIPFISNELVFDDQFFYIIPLSYFATTPIDLTPRTFPYFTYASIHTLWPSFEIQRLLNTLIHCINSLLLFTFIKNLLSANTSTYSTLYTLKPANHATFTAAALAITFTLHPVAVYAVGYLVQRTILLATTFSLLSLLKVEEWIRTKKITTVFFSASFSIAAMFSKEHAVTLPIAAISLILFLQPRPNRNIIKNALIYLSICLPAMLWITFSSRNNLATTYEIHAALYIPDIGNYPWARSALMESGLYFQYLRQWLLPDTSFMSIDLRYHFPNSRPSLQFFFGGLAFLLAFFGSGYFLLHTKQLRLVGFGLAYSQILFLVELSTIRVQEPFVLYRSYLWAPGFLIMAASFFHKIKSKYLVLALVFILPIIACQSANRLDSLSTSQKVWDDALAKLGGDNLPGAFRIYYNMGIQHMRATRYDKAMESFVACHQLNPEYAGCLSGQAQVFFKKKEYEQALIAIESALLLDSHSAAIWETKGKILQALNQKHLAELAFQNAAVHGGSLATLLRQGKLPN